MIYTPKGSMCLSCKDAKKNCSHLDFSKMPIIKKTHDQTFVKCTFFKSKNNLTLK